MKHFEDLDSNVNIVCHYTIEDVIKNTTITGIDDKKHYYYMYEGFKGNINVKQNSNANILNNNNNMVNIMQDNSGILSSGS